MFSSNKKGRNLVDGDRKSSDSDWRQGGWPWEREGSKMTIRIEKVGRRYYIMGDTYPIRAEIKAAGCRWDREKSAWFSGKKDRAEMLLTQVAGGAIQPVCSWRKLSNGFGVAVPSGLSVKAGDVVTVRAANGAEKQVELLSEVAPGVWSVPERKRATSSRRTDCRKYGWDGVYGSSSYYTSGQYDEDS